MPTWARVAIGFAAPTVLYATWGAYVFHVTTQANAAQAADPTPAPDAAGATAALFYALPTICLVIALIVTGGLLCISQTLRPAGLGVVSGATLPVVILIVAWLAMVVIPLTDTLKK